MNLFGNLERIFERFNLTLKGIGVRPSKLNTCRINKTDFFPEIAIEMEAIEKDERWWWGLLFVVFSLIRHYWRWWVLHLLPIFIFNIETGELTLSIKQNAENTGIWVPESSQMRLDRQQVKEIFSYLQELSYCGYFNRIYAGHDWVHWHHHSCCYFWSRFVCLLWLDALEFDFRYASRRSV